MHKMKLAMGMGTTMLLTAGMISLGAAGAQAAEQERPWNDTYYLSGYNCPAVVGLAFRGSGEERETVNPLTQLRAHNSEDYPAAVMRSVAPWYDYAMGNANGPTTPETDTSDTDPLDLSDPDDYTNAGGAYKRQSLLAGGMMTMDGRFDSAAKRDPNVATSALRATDTAYTNGWEGGLISRLTVAWSSARFFPVAGDNFPIIGIGEDRAGAGYGYQAIDVVNARAGKGVIDSAYTGGQAGIRYIQTVKDYYASQGCTTVPRFIVIGYSQGAVAAKFTAVGAPHDVLSSYLFGDAYLDSKSQHQQGQFYPHGRAALTGTGILIGVTDEFESPGRQAANSQHLNDNYDAVQERVIFCHKDDTVCDFQWLSSIVPWALGSREHTVYLRPHIGYPENIENDDHDYEELATAGYSLAVTVSCIQSASEGDAGCSFDDDTPVFNLKAAQTQQAQMRALKAAYAATAKRKPQAAVSASIPGKKTLFTVPKLAKATYRYDFNGDGRWDLTSRKRVVNHVYKVAGDSKVKILAQRGKQRKLYRLTVHTVAPDTSAAMRWYLKAYDLQATTAKIQAGKLQVQVAGLPANAEYGVRIVKTSGDAFGTVPTRYSKVLHADGAGRGSTSLSVKGIVKGAYKIAVVTPSGYHAVRQVTIR